jgi:hypothetical protein
VRMVVDGEELERVVLQFLRLFLVNYHSTIAPYSPNTTPIARHSFSITHSHYLLLFCTSHEGLGNTVQRSNRLLALRS